MKTTRREFLKSIIWTAVFAACTPYIPKPFKATAVSSVAIDDIGDGIVFDGVGAHFDGGWYFSGTKQPPLNPTRTPYPTATPKPTSTPTRIFKEFLPIITR